MQRGVPPLPTRPRASDARLDRAGTEGREGGEEEAPGEQSGATLCAEYERMRERAYARFLREVFPCAGLDATREEFARARGRIGDDLAGVAKVAATIACHADCMGCRVARTMYDFKERRFLRLEHMSLELLDAYYPSDRLGNFVKM